MKLMPYVKTSTSQLELVKKKRTEELSKLQAAGRPA
jgi:hypothetical protein